MYIRSTGSASMILENSYILISKLMNHLSINLLDDIKQILIKCNSNYPKENTNKNL